MKKVISYSVDEANLKHTVEVFANNTKVTFLYKIDMEGF